jgi:hypothetical protein
MLSLLGFCGLVRRASWGSFVVGVLGLLRPLLVFGGSFVGRPWGSFVARSVVGSFVARDGLKSG